jgi:hypothetical protein
MTCGQDMRGAADPLPRRRDQSALALQPVLRPFSRPRNLILAAGVALSLAACSGVDFPAVHDMPTARPAADRLSAEEQKKAEAELVAARDIQRTGTLPPPAVTAAKPAAATVVAKKKPAAAPTREAAAGNGPNP